MRSEDNRSMPPNVQATRFDPEQGEAILEVKDAQT